MPLYFGHKNTKGLSVSPALQSLKIDLLRAAPSAVNVIARPTVTQPGYASYVSHLSAFMEARIRDETILLNKQGYPANFPVEKILPIGHPPLVIDYNGPPPAKHVETLSTIGFERIKIHSRDNILRFPSIALSSIRKIKETEPNARTPAPVNTVNLEAFDIWVFVLRTVSCLLSTHIYPAFRDDGHQMEEIETMVDELMTTKREAPTPLEGIRKRRRGELGEVIDDASQEVEGEGGDVEMDEQLTQPDYVILRRAKPPSSNEPAWGLPETIPNASGLFFPYIPELASYDDSTVPRLIEDYLLQSIGSTVERQIDRMARIRSAWGLICKTDSGNTLSHLCKVIHLSLTSQGRSFPLIQDGIYQGSVLCGGRLFVGLNGQIYRPLPFDKLQEEAGGYHLHSRVLIQIAEIVAGGGTVADDQDARRVMRCTSLRMLRDVLLEQSLSEEERDEIRKLAIHLHFKNDNCLPVNPQSLMRVLDSMSASAVFNDQSLPMHHSALFSRDSVLVSLAAFGFQAPSFMIDNCPKVQLSSAKPPNTLVLRQKTLDVATLDWKTMMNSQEIRNNPRNLSRANRDRTLTSNDKTVIWGKLKSICDMSGQLDIGDTETGGAALTQEDNLEDW